MKVLILSICTKQHAYLIRGHGLYAWGATVDQARHRVEALEFLFECELYERLMKTKGGQP